MAGSMAAQTKISAEQDILKHIDIRGNELTNEYLDTLSIKKNTEINDYSMIGVHYGMGLSRVMWNPTQQQDMLLVKLRKS